MDKIRNGCCCLDVHAESLLHMNLGNGNRYYPQETGLGKTNNWQIMFSYGSLEDTYILVCCVDLMKMSG